MMEEKITRWGGLTYDLPIIYSEEVVIRSTAAVSAKAGHLLFWNSTNKGYEAFAAATDLTAKTGIPVVVLMEDVEIPAYTPEDDGPPETPASGEITAKAIISGRVYKDFVRAAGIEETALPDSSFSTLGGKVIFLGTEDHTEGGEIA